LLLAGRSWELPLALLLSALSGKRTPSKRIAAELRLSGLALGKNDRELAEVGSAALSQRRFAQSLARVTMLLCQKNALQR